MARIMIADDSRTSRRMLLDIIRQLGFVDIVEAVDGEDAINKFREYRPEIVTLDITMPRMDGIQALEQIMAEAPQTKVIMITAAAQNSKLKEAVRLGASEFISKPYEVEQVSRILKDIVTRV